MVAYDLERHQFRPYSLRRGGATHLFQITHSMETTLARRRWESSKVAKVSYLGRFELFTKLEGHKAYMSKPTAWQ